MKLRALETIGVNENNLELFSLRLSIPDPFFYIEINGLFFRLNQNPITLARFLFWGSKPLKMRSKFRTSRLIRALKIFVLYRLGIKKEKEIKQFQIFCHLIFKTHGGYRAFNFKKKTVTKIFFSDCSKTKVLEEIEGVRKASQLSFAPRIIQFNTVDNWYEEEYVDGVIGYSLVKSEDQAIANLFRQEIIHCLEKMILFNSPIRVTVGRVINECSKIWKYNKLSRVVHDSEGLDSFYQFVQLTLSKLLKFADQNIYLIFSHGDFSLQNILITKNELKVIDWEGISNRSVLYDLHNFFLTELYYGRASKFLVNELKNAITSLQTNLISSNSKIDFNLVELSEIYRWLFYIERICMLLQRGLSDKILDVISRSINVFSEFERTIFSQK